MAIVVRRQFLIAAGGLLAARFVRARAKSVYRIGWLPSGPKPPRDVHLEAFIGGMRELGYVEGRDFVVEPKYNEAGLPLARLMARMRELTDELGRVPVDVILVANTIAADAARGATRTTPIVMAAAANPVAAGLLESLARPGGNVTGLTLDTAEITAKRLELLKETIPGLRRVGAVHPVEARSYTVIAQWLRDCAAAADKLGLAIEPVDLPVDVTRWEDAFAAATARRLQAVTIVEAPTYFRHRAEIGTLSLKHRLATMAFTAEHVEAGCLMAYGAAMADLYRRAAGYVDRILRGANPVAMPVELPTKFDFAANIRTARALGLTVPDSVLLRATRVLE